MNDTLPVLYILMRNDMASMNAGKAMAQASHASNAFVRHANMHFNDKADDVAMSEDEIDYHNYFQKWVGETDQGFGTVLVLAVNERQLTTVIEVSKSAGFIADTVFDPTYPLVDGDVVHYLPIVTCGYVFGEKSDPMLKAILGNFSLHP